MDAGYNNIDKYINNFLNQGTFAMVVLPSEESENAKSVVGEIEFFKNQFQSLDVKITFANSISNNKKLCFFLDDEQNFLSIVYKNNPKEETSTYKPHFGNLLIKLPDGDFNDYPLKGSYTNHERDTKGKVLIYKSKSDILVSGS